MRGSVTRIEEGVMELEVDSTVPSQWPGASPTDMWMLLIVRMITRVAHIDDGLPEDEGNETQVSEEQKTLELYSRQDNLRQTLCNYVMADFPSRYELHCASLWSLTIFRLPLITIWMNEEWYNDRIRMADDPDWVSAMSLLFLISLVQYNSPATKLRILVKSNCLDVSDRLGRQARG